MPEISLPTKLTQDQIKTIVDQILLQVNQKNTSRIKRSLTFTADGVWNVPNGVTEIYVTGGGGGGSGSSPNSTSSANTKGNDGTDTILTNGVNTLRLKGGKGGEVAGAAPFSSTETGGNAGGNGGQAGRVATVSIFNNNSYVSGGDGGNSGPYFGGRYSSFQGASASKNGNYCSGGAGGQAFSQSFYSNGGGGAEFVYNKTMRVTPLSELTITIGKGGESVVGTAGYHSGSGGNGIVTIEWWE